MVKSQGMQSFSHLSSGKTNIASTHRIHVWYIYLHLVDFMVNVKIYTIHGSYGIYLERFSSQALEHTPVFLLQLDLCVPQRVCSNVDWNMAGWKIPNPILVKCHCWLLFIGGGAFEHEHPNQLSDRAVLCIEDYFGACRVSSGFLGEGLGLQLFILLDSTVYNIFWIWIALRPFLHS